MPVDHRLGDSPTIRAPARKRRVIPALALLVASVVCAASWRLHARSDGGADDAPLALVAIDLDAPAARDSAELSMQASDDPRLAQAQRFELEGRLGDAQRGYETLTHDADTARPIAERAAARLAHMADDARTRLLEARAAATENPHEAERLLELALERFSGTTYADDLLAVLRRLLRDGRFPALVESDRSA